MTISRSSHETPGDAGGLRLVLPWPPSVNRIWRAFGGRIILAAISRKFYREAAAALPKGRIGPPLTVPVLVWIELHPPASMGRRRWDLANREKLLCDALTKQRIWHDDSQIDAIVLVRRPSVDKRGQAVVTIQTLPGGCPL